MALIVADTGAVCGVSLDVFKRNEAPKVGCFSTGRSFPGLGQRIPAESILRDLWEKL